MLLLLPGGCRVQSHSIEVKQVYYPKNSESKANYDSCRRPDGGYGGLLSATFYTIEEASGFFDALATAKGPSLGTNFTLCSPYTLLAHYRELDWVSWCSISPPCPWPTNGMRRRQVLVLKRLW